MNKKVIISLKLFSIFIFIIAFFGTFSSVDAASATISSSSNSVTAGNNVNIYVNINAAAWNVHVNGTGISDSIVGYDEDGNNKNTNKVFTLNTTNPGTYTVSISGDVTDESSKNINVSSSVTIAVTPKPAINNNNNSSNNNNNNNNNTNIPHNVPADTRSKNANLSSLNIEGIELNPEFNENTTTYNATVKYDISELSVSAIPADNKSTTVVNGNIDLVEGDNNVTVTVTAENGTKKVYTIIVKKEKNPDDMNAFLSSLVINNATLKSEFDSEILEYMCDDISADISKLDIVANTKIEGATYEIIGNDELKLGINTIIIKVKSKDESETKEYKLIVFKNNEVLSIQEEPINTKNNFKTLIKNNIITIIMYFFILIEFIIIVILFYNVNKLKNKGNNKQGVNKNTDIIENKNADVSSIDDNIDNKLREEKIEDLTKEIQSETENMDDNIEIKENDNDENTNIISKDDEIKSKMDLNKLFGNNKEK